jgi:uncharacterized MAPEG superfamily protein
MTTELEMLTWATALTILLWIPYTLARIMNVGLLPTLTYKSDDTPLAAWATRAKKAHANAIENLAPFAVLVLVAHQLDISNTAYDISGCRLLLAATRPFYYLHCQRSLRPHRDLRRSLGRATLHPISNTDPWSGELITEKRCRGSTLRAQSSCGLI